ncbi:hypothetical protein FDECE_9997 [Fusarium decemcellulare]|nr:hypothetical protein FDECE_9997 [Fusarium decemcellulare]
MSDITAATIRNWKLRCDTSQSSAHTICSRPNPKFFPTRLIEIVRIDTEGQHHHVRLVDGKSLKGVTEYAALSYCWGGNLEAALSQGNITSYLTEIPWDCIPKTIQDAILTSHMLGIGFLWVDSFCIIQDSNCDDKNIEIGQMTQVYTHAAFTIAARRASNAHTGFLHNRSLPSGTSIVNFQSEDGQIRECTLTFQLADTEEDETVLNTRGWTFQEYLLSRRLLIIGTWTTVWSCRKERHANRDGWFLNRDKGDPFQNDGLWTRDDNSVFKGTHRFHAIAFFAAHPECDHPRPKDHFILEGWEWIVRTYTHRHLTKPTDRILAISGLAEIFSPMRGQEYAAGLWVKDFPFTLLWSIDSQILLPRPTQQGPSWSWTAINSPITWGVKHGKAVLEVKYIDCQLDQQEAPFGSVRRGAIRVAGPALDLELKFAASESDMRRSGGSQLRYLTGGGKYIDAHIEFLPDAQEIDSDWATATLLAIRVDYSTTGIILKKRNDSEYTRLGFFNAHLPGDTYRNFFCELPGVGDWSSREFTII